MSRKGQSKLNPEGITRTIVTPILNMFDRRRVRVDPISRWQGGTGQRG